MLASSDPLDIARDRKPTLGGINGIDDQGLDHCIFHVRDWRHHGHGAERAASGYARRPSGAAKTAAGFDFLGTLGRLCIAAADRARPRRRAWPDACARDLVSPSRRRSSTTSTSSAARSTPSWALTTSEGIILIDTIYPYNSEELIVGGMQKLGLDPEQVKYIIITHGHGDHVGGAKTDAGPLQVAHRDGRAGLGVVENSVNQLRPGPTTSSRSATSSPATARRSRSATRRVQLVFTPGHTPGTFSMFFDVKDNGKPLTVAYSGGTAFNFVNTVENFETYINSQRKMADRARTPGDRRDVEPLRIRQRGQQGQDDRCAAGPASQARSNSAPRRWAAISRCPRNARGSPN